jgi:surface protein
MSPLPLAPVGAVAAVCPITSNGQLITVFLELDPHNRLLSFNELFKDDTHITGFYELPPWGSQGAYGGMPVGFLYPYSVTNYSSMFRETTNLRFVQMSTNAGIEMKEMFQNSGFVGAEAESNMAYWRMGYVTSIQLMFDRANNFNGDIGRWDTSRVTDMSGTFRLTNFDRPLDWNTDNVTDMSRMFDGASFNQDISSWNTGNVRNMRSMFEDAENFNQNISAWRQRTTNVQDCTDFARGSGLQDRYGNYNYAFLPFDEERFRGHCE